jgi:AAA15 family ATPase/GTPase
MQLIIQNLGSIKQGQIDLSKRFYIFVGYNNSGKTYVSQLLWSLFNEETFVEFADNEEITTELAKSIDIEQFNFEDEGCFEITPDLTSQILERFSRFLSVKLCQELLILIKTILRLINCWLNLIPISISSNRNL